MDRTRRYLDQSRAPRYSILFAVPLLIAYEASAFLLADSNGAGVRNGADVLLKSLFVILGGRRGLLVFDLVLAAVATWFVVRDWRRHPGPLRTRFFAAMFAESAVLALLLGAFVGALTAAVVPRMATAVGGSELDTGTLLMISLGAGIYEELLFRVLLVGALALGARRVLGWSIGLSGVFAALVGALVFSGFHYIGTYGDPMQLDTFTFRFLAGLVFSVMYLTRGFGITAWTHALYDVYITLG